MRVDVGVLFLASSKTQEKQYMDICKLAAVNGVVVNIKHPGMGNLIDAAVWFFNNKQKYSEWTDFQVKKNSLEKIATTKLLHAGYIFRSILALAAVIKAVRRNNLQFLYLRNGFSYIQQAVISWAKESGVKIIYTENGQLPATFVLDTSGVNFNSSVPKDKNFYLALDVPSNIVVSKKLIPRKAKVESTSVIIPKNYYFVPFQVPTDSQVLIQSPWIDSMDKFYGLLERAVSFLPEDHYFVIKEHPSSMIKYDQLHSRNTKIIFANGNDTQELIENSKCVITLNSSVGVEALMLGKKVLTLGKAFYNIDRLVNHVSSEQSFRQFVANPDDLVRDEELVRRFVWWLEHDYLLPGKLREFEKDPKCLRAFVERLNRIILFQKENQV